MSDCAHPAITDAYATVCDVEDELPRVAGKTGFSSTTKPTVDAVGRWIATESRWLDAGLRNHVEAGKLPLRDTVAVEVVRSIVVWRVAARVLLATDYTDLEDRIEELRGWARERMREVLADPGMLGMATGADDASPEGGPGDAYAIDRHFVDRGLEVAYSGYDYRRPW